MQLARLVEGLDGVEVFGDPEVDITGVAFDSRSVGDGALFCCVPGDVVDGHDYAATAVDAGAAAILGQRRLQVAVPQVVVPSVRAAMGPVADTFFDHPSRGLTVVGVTGTNGKTTTTYLLSAVLEAHGWRSGVIGTLTGARTTPEAPELQATLARFRDEGDRSVTMEVSSHALVQHRIDAIQFAAGVFTNLSQDHLDYHGTMDDYFAAKRRLFEPGRVAAAVVNIDDSWGRRLLDGLDPSISAHPYSVADVAGLALDRRGSRFRWRGHPVELRQPGRFNVSNAVAAATTAALLGVPEETVAAGLSTAEPVPGRFELVDAGQSFAVVVDYAHTPDALEQLLTSARELAVGAGGRVALVFGCGGDRDATKRPLMGEVAARLADCAILTSDNPRREDPIAIIDAVRAGVRGGDRHRLVVEPDRRTAIRLAVAGARSGDVVVIAGKGHETGQEVGGVVTPFDDREVAREALGGAA